MLNGLYSSATALNINLNNQDLVSHNLAHVNVPGFKRVMQVVETLPDSAGNLLHTGSNSSILKSLNGSHVIRELVDFSQGRIERTNNPLNIALNGEGFLVVQGEEGPLYTRNGNFKVNDQRQLILPTGEVVESESGPITLPPNSPVGEIVLGPQGNVSLQGQPIGKLQIVKFAEPQRLEQVGTTLFRAPNGVTSQPAEDVQVQQFHLESSNSHAVTEMIKMIAGMRHFEAAQKSLTAISEAISQHANQRNS